jgi:hypothetical protein
MAAPHADEILAATRQLLSEARRLIDGGEPLKAAPRGDVLGLYEALCRELDAVDGDRLRIVLGRIAEQIEQLHELAADVERIRRLRDSIRAA